MTFSEFIERLQAIEGNGPHFNNIDGSHPFIVSYGKKENRTPTLWISFNKGVTDTSPDCPPSTRCIDIAKIDDGKRADIFFFLKETGMRDLFYAFCFDLFSFLAQCAPKTAQSDLLERYDSWRHLFEAGRLPKLSPEALKGLLGEVLVLTYFLKNGRGNAVDAWGGPTKADRDFEFPDRWAEVKSASLAAQNITISSLEQLDVDQEGDLHLLRIEDGTVNRAGAISLSDAVTECETLLPMANDRLLFKAKLELAGYDPNQSLCAEKRFTLHGHAIYAVVDAFPRLRRTVLPAAIAKAQYSLDIIALQPFKRC